MQALCTGFPQVAMNNIASTSSTAALKVGMIGYNQVEAKSKDTTSLVEVPHPAQFGQKCVDLAS